MCVCVCVCVCVCKGMCTLVRVHLKEIYAPLGHTWKIRKNSANERKVGTHRTTLYRLWLPTGQ